MISSDIAPFLLRVFEQMSALSLFVFFITSFGIASAIRTIEIFFENRLIDRSLRSKLRFIVPFMIVALVLFLSHRPLLLWFAMILFVVSLFLSQIFVRNGRETKFQTDFLEFLERTILLVRTGKPIRLALTTALEDLEPFARQKLEKILEFVFFSPHSDLGDADSFMRSTVRELSSIDRSTHRSLERLVAYRRTLRIEFDFRQKAGQCLRRVRWQSFILTGLYIALLIFMFSQFRWSEIQFYVSISVTFFVTGLLWIASAGRKVKWKI